MADTVTTSAIIASLEHDGPSFILNFGSDSPRADAVGQGTSFHVSGAAQPPLPTTVSAPLAVEFVTWRAAPAPAATPPTVSGGIGAGLPPLDASPGVTGAMKINFDHWG